MHFSQSIEVHFNLPNEVHFNQHIIEVLFNQHIGVYLISIMKCILISILKCIKLFGFCCVKGRQLKHNFVTAIILVMPKIVNIAYIKLQNKFHVGILLTYYMKVDQLCKIF